VKQKFNCNARAERFTLSSDFEAISMQKQAFFRLIDAPRSAKLQSFPVYGISALRRHRRRTRV
jgi:hypothetical protein